MDDDHPRRDARQPLLSVQAALILFLALFCGGAILALSMAAGQGLAAASLPALAATGGALALFDKIID